MNLPEKIGQLFLLGFEGDKIERNHPIVDDITHRHLGGVILFDRLLAKQSKSNNITSAEQVKELTSTLHELSLGKLLISVDQEGGKVCRLSPKQGFEPIPSAEEQGANGNEALLQESANKTAHLLSQLGINLNLAPVVDLNAFQNNPVIGCLQRSYSPQPEIVVKCAKIWITAHRKYGVLSCLKHYPGHGSSHKDSHLGFTDITDTWQEEELTPYRKLINSNWADAIMTGHLYNANLDPNHPATLSFPIVTQLLRNNMGYKGIVISDDMQMKAITERYGLEEAIPMAFSAGVDMIIIGNNLRFEPNILTRSIAAVIKAIDKGIVSENSITEAYKRVINFKKSLEKPQPRQQH